MAAAKYGSAAHDAVIKQVPRAVIVTVAVALAEVPATGDTVQTPVVPVIVGMVLAFVVAVTTNVLLTAAVAGAPVKVTVGVRGAALIVPRFDHAEQSGTGLKGAASGELGL